VRTFVCESCEKRVANPYQRIVVRTEYRFHHTQKKYRVTTDAYLCKGCVDLLLADDKPKTAPLFVVGDE
jgi:hypothetical protein